MKNTACFCPFETKLKAKFNILKQSLPWPNTTDFEQNLFGKFVRLTTFQQIQPICSETSGPNTLPAQVARRTSGFAHSKQILFNICSIRPR
mgnify:CR=1 FL=1